MPEHQNVDTPIDPTNIVDRLLRDAGAERKHAEGSSSTEFVEARRRSINPSDGELVDALPADLVLSELHHRWFNNLAMLSGSLRVCGARSQSIGEIRLGIADIDRQIQSMAAMHRRLYEPPTAPHYVEGYCRELCLDVVRAMGREDIAPWVNMCDVSLSPKVLSVLGAIVVELMTNALKHGRSPRDGGIVWLRLRQLLCSDLELVVTDNFLPPKGECRIPALLQAMVSQLGGCLAVSLSPGYTSKLTIPVH